MWSRGRWYALPITRMSKLKVQGLFLSLHTLPSKNFATPTEFVQLISARRNKKARLFAGLMIHLHLPDVAGIRPNHGLARFASPGFLKFRHVLYHTVRAIVAG
jgi:hypothetical protein